MADNTTLNTGSGGDLIVTREISHGGDTSKVQGVFVMGVSGTEGAYTAAAIDGTAANGLEVDVTRVQGTVTVDGSGVTQPISGTVTANLSATDNAVLDAIAASLVDVETNTNYGAVVGGGVEATALRVTLASDSTGVLTVDDGGGALTVDGTVAATQSGTWNITNVSGTVSLPTGAATAANQTTANTALANIETAVELIDNAAATIGTTDLLRVALFDDSNSQITSFGGGTEYTEDAIAAADPVGKATILVREDSPVSIAADGDNVAQRGTAYGAAYVQIVDSSGNFINTFGGSGGTASTDDSAFTAGSGSGTPVMGFFSADTVNAGDVGVLAMDASRRLLVSLEVDNAGIGPTEYAEDSTHNTGDSGVMALAVRNDTLAALAGTDGDYAPLQVSAAGALYVEAVGAATDDTSTLTSGTTEGSPIMAAAAPTDTAVDANDLGVLGMTTGRALYVSIENDSVGIGGGTQYTEDAAAAANPVGNAVILVRDDTPGAITSADGDNIAQRGTNYGAAFVQVVDSSGNFIDTFGGSGGTAAADDADFVAGTTSGTPVMGVYESTPTSVTDGDLGTVGITSTRSLKVQETNSAAILADTANMDTNLGTIAGAVSGTEMQVDIVSAPTLTVDLGVNNDVTVTSGNITADTELPTAAALADNTANPTVPAVGAFGMVWDGSTWDRTPGTSADGVLVNLGSNNDVTVTGTVTANAGTNLNTSALALESGGNLATIAGAVSGSEMQVDIVAALPAGTNNIGDVDVATIAAGSNLIGDVGLSGARTSGGTTIFRSIDLDETEEQVKGTAGQVYWIHAINMNAATRYLKFYNATAASVTVGTTTPVLTFPIPPNSTTGGGFVMSVPNGIAFGTAITVAATTGVADSDTGAPGANEVILNLGYA